MFLFGCALFSLMAIALFAGPPIRRAALRLRQLLSAHQSPTGDRGWVVVEVLVVLLIASIVLATMIFVVGILANARR